MAKTSKAAAAPAKTADKSKKEKKVAAPVEAAPVSVSLQPHIPLHYFVSYLSRPSPFIR